MHEQQQWRERRRELGRAVCQWRVVRRGTVEGKAITIGFSAPEADHGWIGAITSNAKSQAGKYSEVTLEAVEGTNDVNQQISQVETLISKKVDVIVILPFDGKALTSTGLKAQLAGIPVVNLDRVFADPRASRTWIGGDNYGMGVAAGTYIAAQMKAKGITDPKIAEIQGIASLPLTQQRSQGFADALKEAGFKVSNQVSAQFTVESGQSVTATCCRPHPSSTRSGTTTTTRVSASWRRSTRPAARSSSWSGAPAPRTSWTPSRRTTRCSRPR